MQDLLDKIDKSRMPRHVAIIMDGNGRWAKEKNQDRLYGHFHGVESVRDIVEGPVSWASNILHFMPLAPKIGTGLCMK